MREGRGLPSWRGSEGRPESASPGARNVPEPSLTLGVGDVFVLFDNVKGKEIVFILCVSLSPVIPSIFCFSRSGCFFCELLASGPDPHFLLGCSLSRFSSLFQIYKGFSLNRPLHKYHLSCNVVA